MIIDPPDRWTIAECGVILASLRPFSSFSATSSGWQRGPSRRDCLAQKMQHSLAERCLRMRLQEDTTVELLATTVFPLAAIGYSIVYLLLGGGFVGAFLVFFLAKMLGK
jgi:hypothetical protein